MGLSAISFSVLCNADIRSQTQQGWGQGAEGHIFSHIKAAKNLTQFYK